MAETPCSLLSVPTGTQILRKKAVFGDVFCPFSTLWPSEPLPLFLLFSEKKGAASEERNQKLVSEGTALQIEKTVSFFLFPNGVWGFEILVYGLRRKLEKNEDARLVSLNLDGMIVGAFAMDIPGFNDTRDKPED